MELEQAIREYEAECQKFRDPVQHYLELKVDGDLYDIMIMPRDPIVISSREIYIGHQHLKDGTKEQAIEKYMIHTDGLRYITGTPNCLFIKDEFRITS
jgi:hypothetical protein